MIDRKNGGILLPRSPQPVPVPAIAYKPAVIICKIGAKTQNGDYT